jgi:hypothetical protein
MNTRLLLTSARPSVEAVVVAEATEVAVTVNAEVTVAEAVTVVTVVAVAAEVAVVAEAAVVSRASAPRPLPLDKRVEMPLRVSPRNAEPSAEKVVSTTNPAVDMDPVTRNTVSLARPAKMLTHSTENPERELARKISRREAMARATGVMRRSLLLKRVRPPLLREQLLRKARNPAKRDARESQSLFPKRLRKRKKLDSLSKTTSTRRLPRLLSNFLLLRPENVRL